MRSGPCSAPASGAINWNGGGVDTDVAEGGINRFPMGLCSGAGTILKGHDDWSNLLYEFRTTKDYADSVHQSVPEEHDLIELLAVVPDEDLDTVSNLIDNCPLVPADPDSFAGVVSYPVSCSTGTGSIDTAVEELAAGESGLSYNGDGNWQFNWKTLASYKGTCRVLAVRFKYGTTSAEANFKFK